MTLESRTIGDVVADINTRYFLPAIQRPFVWTSGQVIALCDSLMKGYPIAAFLTWEAKPEQKRDLQIYRFIENWRVGAQNKSTSADGLDVTFVLDGQQRFTSFLIALRGSFSEKAKHKRHTSPDAWRAGKLYIDLLHDPDIAAAENDSGLGLTCGFTFCDVAPRNDHRQHWFRVGDIMNCRTSEERDGLIEHIQGQLHHGVTRYDRELASRIMRRLHEVIWITACVHIHVERESSVDRVLDIFVRANDGGTKLSKSDLMLSFVTSQWRSGSARDEINGFGPTSTRSLGDRTRSTRISA